ncbi:MAG: hypothetical protein WC342_07705 [Methanoregula sp.]|jgi:hypothetical protein
MKFQKITPIVAIGSVVIVAGIIILIVLSPVPWRVYLFFHQPIPDAVCFAPPADQHTMNSLWETMVSRTGIDNTTAAFDDMQVRLAPDGTIDHLALSFYATKDKSRGYYQADLYYDPDTCGILRIHSSPIDPPAYVTNNSRSPQVILDELATINLTALGLSGKPVFLMTPTSMQTNVTFESRPCTELFLLKNGTIIPLDKVVLHDTQADATYWNIFSEHCVDVPGYGQSCQGHGGIIVFSADRIGDAEIVPGVTGQPTIRECPLSPMEGQSCTQTMWGTSCINWTINAAGELEMR